MKKLLLIVCMLFISATSVHASSGKNLLNPSHFELTGQTLSTTQALPVESSTDYTLSFPDFIMLDEMEIIVEGESGTTYVNEVMLDNQDCVMEGYYTVCKITTASDETGLMMTFKDGFIGQFYTHHGMYDFQLELGSERTSYEPFEDASDTTSPLLQGAGEVTVNYAKNKSLQTIIDESVTVTDNTDGDITDQIIVVDDEYTGNQSIPGSYVVVLSATDQAGNETQFELLIHVVDEVPPVIQGPTTISVQVDHLIAIDTLIGEYFTLSDALDGDCEAYEITSDAYSPASEVGEYPVTIRTQDKAGNMTSRTFSVSIESNLPAVIEGPDSVTLYLSSQPNDTDITVLYTATDRATLDAIPIQIIATEINDYADAGRYDVTIQATDSFDNVATKTILVVLEDDIPPIFTYDDQIVTALGSPLSDLDLFNVIKSYYKDQGIIVDQLSVLQDEYSGNENTEGEYAYTAEIVSSTGESFVHNGRIAVIDEPVGKAFDMTPMMWVGAVTSLLFTGLLILKKNN